MKKTERTEKKPKKQSNTFANWILVVQKVRGVSTLPSVDDLKDLFERLGTSAYVFQKEKGEKKGKIHWQCCFKLEKKTRQGTLLNKICAILEKCKRTQFTVARQIAHWEDNVSYCSLARKRVEGEVVHSSFKLYDGSDLFVMAKANRRPFQQRICDMVLDEQEENFKPAHPRFIYWLVDEKGCSGKSFLVKWFLYHFKRQVAEFSCNTDAQLRSACIDAGPRSLIFVDISRGFNYQDNFDNKIANVMSTIEDMKNGKISSAFYGVYKHMLTEAPHVFVFSNRTPPPRMVTDTTRWQMCSFDKNFNLRFDGDKETNEKTEEVRERVIINYDLMNSLSV